MKLMVIDGNSIVIRAYYGIRPLTTRDGLYTHAVFGFLTTLLRLKSEEEPDALCVTFDVHAPTFRHQASEAYKATRKGMPEELQMQMPVLKGHPQGDAGGTPDADAGAEGGAGQSAHPTV